MEAPKAVAQPVLGADHEIIDKYYVSIGEEAQEKRIQMLIGSGIPVAQRHRKALAYLASLDDKNDELQKIEEILRG